MIVQNAGKVPPRIHNLTQLAGLAGVTPNATQLSLFYGLTELYIGSRYPVDIEEFRQLDSPKVAQDFLDQTVQVFQWLSQQIK